MVKTETWVGSLTTLSVFLMMPLMFGLLFLLAPYGPVADFSAIIISEGVMWGLMRGTRELARLLAGLIHHVKCRPTSRKEPYGWKWPGAFAYRWKDHPETIDYLSDYVMQDGSKGAYLTKLKVSLLNDIHHPYYNRGGRLKNMFWLHKYPYDEQFAEDADTVTYMGVPCKNVSSVSWANLAEVMPSMEYFRDPKAWNKLKGKHNHVPYVEPKDFSHTPWFEVTDSSGMRAARENRVSRERQRRRIQMAMATGPKGATSGVPLCPECNEPLKVESGLGECKNGHKWNELS